MKLLLTAMLCISLLGCAQSGEPRIVDEPKAPKPKMAKEKYNDVSHPRLEILYGSKNIYKWINIKNPRFGTAWKLPKFAVTIENRTQSALPVEYQINWLDADRFPLPVATPAWIRFTLPENAEKNIVDIAKMPEAYFAQILIRGSKDIQILVPLPLNEDGDIDYPNLYN